jgi:hypothetical protein
VGTLSAGSIPSSLITGLAASATTDTTNASNITSGTLPSARLAGSYPSVTGVGTLSSGSIPATLLTGTIDTARVSGSYTGITGVGTVTTGTWSGSFGAVSGANLTTLNASNLSSGTVASARISGSYTGITAVGTLTSKLNVDGANSVNIGIGDWSSGAQYSAMETSYGYLLLGAAGDQRVYLRTIANDVRIGTPSVDTLVVSGTNVGIYRPLNAVLENAGNNIYISGSTGSFVQHSTNTGSGNAAQWTAVFGVQVLVRNTSTRDDKENFQPLGDILTAEMIDAIDVSLWNRKNAPNCPEVGPMAEDMDAISPFLATHGMDLDGEGNVVSTPPNGISPNGWMSLLTIALQDCRRRIAELESR